MFKYIVASALLACACAQTPISQCGNGFPLPSSVDFNGCVAEPCQLPQGSMAKMNVTFTAQRDLETMHAEVLAYALGIETPYPLPQSDACQSLVNTACPVATGEEVVYHAEMEILDIFPQIPFEIDFSVLDQAGGQGIVCFHIRAEVV